MKRFQQRFEPFRQSMVETVVFSPIVVPPFTSVDSSRRKAAIREVDAALSSAEVLHDALRLTDPYA